MENFDAGIYSEAKGEYTRQLTLFIVPSFHKFFMDCLTQAAEEEPESNKQLWKFQELISQVPEWNVDKVQREIQKLVGSIHCDYLEELVTAVFIAHTKVLTAIRIGSKNKRVQITIPKLDHFLHRSLSECSRLLWSSAYLFHNELTPIEKQKNHRQIEQLLHEGVLQAIRGLLPVKHILKDYLAEPEANEEEEEEKDDEKDDAKGDEKDAEKEEKESEKDAEKEEKKDSVSDVQEPVTSEDTSRVDTIPEKVKAEEVKAEEVKPEVQIPEVIKPKEVVPEVVKIPDTLHQPEQHPVTPTIVVETEPSVRFTNFDQVIQQAGQTTRIGYVEKDRSDAALEAMDILEGDGESLSDFEDLEEGPLEPIGLGDYEVLT